MWLFFGGVYGNLQALTALQRLAADIAPERIVCTGDIAGYCADPQACYQVIRQWGIRCIAGNVETQLVEDADDCGCNFNDGSACDILSQQWYPYVRARVDSDSKQWLATVPTRLLLSIGGHRVAVVHGGWHEQAAFIFRSTAAAIKQREFAAATADIIIGGHCGIPFADVVNHKLWLNSGALGMPANDGSSRTWYLCCEDSHNGQLHFTFHSLTYDHQSAAARMHGAGLPVAYQRTLANGLWPSCDILPPAETAEQGVPLSLATVRYPS